jgi:NhaA family Na+:H+ antiporter
MTLFSFVVALEFKRELVMGELRNPRMAALSIAAAAGGMLVPAPSTW